MTRNEDLVELLRREYFIKIPPDIFMLMRFLIDSCLSHEPIK